jgi:Sulfotransferase family
VIRKFSKPPGALPAVLHVDSFVSERLGFVYHCVPKALSRSMLEYLAAVDPGGFRVGERGIGVEILGGTDAPTSFSFARNPYSRAVAVYYDKFVNYRGTPGQQDLFGRYERLHPYMQFSEFVDWLATDEGCDERADPHFLSQHYYFLDVTGEPAVDYLGKVESSAEDLAELQGLLGLAPEPLPHVNANTTRERDPFDTSRQWLDVLDDRSKLVLANRYDSDFELLGYERLRYRVRPRFARGRVAPTRRKPSALRQVRVVVNRILASVGLEVRRTRPRR